MTSEVEAVIDYKADRKTLLPDGRSSLKAAALMLQKARTVAS